MTIKPGFVWHAQSKRPETGFPMTYWPSTAVRAGLAQSVTRRLDRPMMIHRSGRDRPSASRATSSVFGDYLQPSTLSPWFDPAEAPFTIELRYSASWSMSCLG